MTQWERLETVFALSRPDRTPVLGGWIACPEHIMKIADVDEETYWADPQNVSIEAYLRLDADGLIDNFVPHRGDFRCVDKGGYLKSDSGQTLDQCLAEIEAMPSPEKVEDDFDFEGEYARLRRGILDGTEDCRGMVWMPAQWGIGATACHYGQFGYENYFLICALHEAHARKLIEVSGARGRLWSCIFARAVAEGIYPHAMLMGEDICTQRGPMVSPEFLEKHFLPELKRGLEPLLEVGCRPVWHCDGDVRQILPMLFEAGVRGLQGFQPECGLNIDTVARMRTREGEPLVIFGPLAVTTELPACSPDDVRAKVRHAIDVCREAGAGLCIFSANTINPDVPLENVLAMYDAAR